MEGFYEKKLEFSELLYGTEVSSGQELRDQVLFGVPPPVCGFGVSRYLSGPWFLYL